MDTPRDTSWDPSGRSDDNGRDHSGHGGSQHDDSGYNPYGPADSEGSYGPFAETPGAGSAPGFGPTERPRGPEDSPQWGKWDTDAPGAAYRGGYDQQGQYSQQHPEGGYASNGAANWQGEGNNAASGEIAPGVAMPGGDLPPNYPVVQGPTKVSISDAFSAAFRYLNASIGPWLGITLIFVVVMVGASIGSATIMSSSIGPDIASNPATVSVPSDDHISAAISAVAILLAVTLIVAFLGQVFLNRGGFEVVDGRAVKFSSFFGVNRWGSLIGVYIVMFVLEAILMLPGIAMIAGGAFLVANDSRSGAVLIALGYVVFIVLVVLLAPVISTMPLLVMDGRATPLDAPIVAWNLVKPQYWVVLGASILASLVSSAGMILFYVGMLYTVPLAIILQVHIYRQLLGGRRVVAGPQAAGFTPANSNGAS